MPTWILLTCLIGTGLVLAITAGLAWFQGGRKPSENDGVVVVEYGRGGKITAVVGLVVASLLMTVLMLIVVAAQPVDSDSVWPLIVAGLGWIVFVLAMAFGCLHLNRVQVGVTADGIYVRRAIGDSFYRFEQIEKIVEVQGESWLVIQPRRGLPIRVSKEMRGWRIGLDTLVERAEAVEVWIPFERDASAIRMLGALLKI